MTMLVIEQRHAAKESVGEEEDLTEFGYGFQKRLGDSDGFLRIFRMSSYLT